MPLLICRLEVSNQSGESGSIEVANPGEQMERIYTYDNNRNLIDIHAPNVPWYNQSFTYDALNRLTDATGWYGTTGYTYDNVGNRLTRTVIGEIENYTYIGGSNKLDQIAGANPISFIYDANGNTTGIDDKTLTYNQNNRLIRVEENSLVLGEYTYNGLGQRAIKEVNGVTTIFHYDLSGKLIAESQPDGTMTAEYLYMGKIRIARVDSGTGNIYYYLNDRLGSPQIMTDDTGTIVWEATYKPFGETTVNPKSTIVNNFRFPGQYYDEETGFHYNYYRYYDPRSGRYLRADPSLTSNLDSDVFFLLYSQRQTPQWASPFIYVGNNPVNFTDPMGLSKECGPCEEKVFSGVELISCLAQRGVALITIGSACAAAIVIPAHPIAKTLAIIGTCGSTAALIIDCIYGAYRCERIGGI